MKKFASVPSSETLTSGIPVLTGNLTYMQKASESEIENRFNDCFAPGILQQAAGIPFSITDTGLGSITVGSGVGYWLDTITNQIRRISIATSDTTVYNASNPSYTVSDGVSGTVSVPQSTGCVNIPINNDSNTYNIVIQYLRTVNLGTLSTPSDYSLHPITGIRMFFNEDDGYRIIVTPTSIPVAGIYLGSVNRTDNVISIDTTGRIYVSLLSQVNLVNNTNIADGVVTNPKLASNAVTAPKIDPSVTPVGSGINNNGTSLVIAVDNATLDLSVGGAVEVKSGGITSTQIASKAIEAGHIDPTVTPTGSGLVNNGSSLGVNVDGTTIKITSNTIVAGTIPGANISGNISGNAATATTAGSCSGNAATSTTTNGLTTSITSGSWYITTTGYAPPAGLYMIVTNNAGCQLVILISGVWHPTGGNSVGGGLMLFDGSNQKLVSGGGAETVYYQKLM